MALRTDGSSDYIGRSASLPSPIAVTMSGWANQQVDRNNFSSLCCLTASPRTNGQLCLQTTSDGTSFNVWFDSGSIAVQEPASGYACSVGVPFYWAITCGGTAAGDVKAYFRTRGSNVFNTTFSSAVGLGATFTPVLMRFGNADTSEFWNGDIWNIKVWDRALTAKELLIESFYERVMFPTSLHLQYLCRYATTPADDTYDYSGNGRTATFNGALVTAPVPGNYGMLRPRRQYWIPFVSAGLDPIEGDMNPTEAADTAAISGEVDVTGDMNVTEGADLAAIAGEVDVTGDLNVTENEAPDVAAIAGEVDVTGDANLLEAADTAAIAGEVDVQGDMTPTDASDVASISGEVDVSGDLSAIEGSDVAAIDGSVLVQGDLAATDALDTAAMAGEVEVQGDMNVIENEAPDIAAINGTNDVIGSMAATDAPDAASIEGSVLVQGDAILTETGSDTAAMAGEVDVTGDLSANEASDTASIDGTVEQPPAPIVGSMAATDSRDTASIIGILERLGILAATDSLDTASITGEVPQVLGDPLPKANLPYVTSEAMRFGVTSGRFRNVQRVTVGSKNGSVEVTYVDNVETSEPKSVIPGDE